MTPDLADLRATFAALHRGPQPLLLPNAWDVASALAFAADGFPAVGTTSLGIAAGAGLPDAARAARRLTVELGRRLSRLPIPVSVDIEDGFADEPEAVADLVPLLGVAGINLEDSTAGRLVDPGRHADKVAAVKERSPEVFLNARVDTFWLGERASVPETVDRALQYVEAGADGIFVPGELAEEQIAALTSALPVPLNVLASPVHTVTRLAALGVRRVSTGSLPYRVALDAPVLAARRLREGHAAPRATSYAEVQERTARFAALRPPAP